MTSITAAPAISPVKKREIFGWAMYDFANSAYTTVVISIVYSAFFVNYLVPEGSEWKDIYWSIAMNISTILAMFLAPIAGIICDFTGRKKSFLWALTLFCSIFTACLYFVQPGQIWLGISIIVVSNTAWMLGEVFCAAFLTDIANKKNMARISGIGWGIGYLGGLVSLLVVLMGIVTANKATDLELYVSQHQWAMVFTGVFFFVAALPTFFFVNERSKAEPGFESIHWPTLFKASLKRLSETWQIVKQLPILFQFFIVFTIYMAGMAIIIKFFGIYIDAELNVSQQDKQTIFLALQISALLGALSFGFLEAWVGAKMTIFYTILWWCAGILGIYFLQELSALTGMEPEKFFTILALIAGAGIGATQSASRTVVGLLSPKKYAAQLFGFWGMFFRLSIILGGTCYALVADSLGRQQGLLVILAFFVVGGIALLFVPLQKGIIHDE